MPVVFVTDREGESHKLEIENGQTVMQVMRDNDLDVEALCGGNCSCATCHVFVAEEWLSKLDQPEEDEAELVSEAECYDEGKSRLSCQITFRNELDGLKVTLASE